MCFKPITKPTNSTELKDTKDQKDKAILSHFYVILLIDFQQRLYKL